MLYIESPYTDPCRNLAMEEYCFDRLTDDVFLLWQNDHTIVVGKYQNTNEVISNRYVEQNGISVVRRLSGGGAVYHDLGNLNFSFIQKNDERDTEFRFEYFTKDIINLLADLGVKAEFNSRNDLVIDGKKFSGNAQYIRRDKILHHGTLLFDSNLETLVHALNVSGEKLKSRAVASVYAQVTNIKPYLKKDMTMDLFKQYIREYFTDLYHMQPYTFGAKEMEEILKSAKNKYETWEWNYGASPSCDIKKEGRCQSGQIEAYLSIKGGILEDIKIYGDFFALDSFENALSKLKGKRYDPANLKEDINNVADTMRGIERGWLLDLIMN